MKQYIRSSRDENFQSDLNSAIYNAISSTVFKYRDMIQDAKALEDAVDIAVDLWSTRYFESDDWES